MADEGKQQEKMRLNIKECELSIKGEKDDSTQVRVFHLKQLTL